MKYVVAGINFFDNVLSVEIIEADDWKDAVLGHSAFINSDEIDREWLPDDIEDAKREAFNTDISFDVIELKADELMVNIIPVRLTVPILLQHQHRLNFARKVIKIWLKKLRWFRYHGDM